jgi:hypothetical protein
MTFLCSSLKSQAIKKGFIHTKQKCEQNVLAISPLKTKSAHAFLFEVVPCGTVPCVATFPCATFFSYPKTIFITPFDLWTPIFHSYEVQFKECFNAMNLVHHFFHIHHLVFHLKKIFLPSNFERFYGVTSFSR